MSTPAENIPENSPKPGVPIALAKTIAAALRRRGVAPDAALKLAQITPLQWRQSRGALSAWQMEAFSGAAMQALDDEALGAFERRLPWGSYGMLARASLSSPDLGLALRRWCRHHGLLTDDIRLRLITHDATALLEIEESARHARLDTASRELSLVHVMRNILGLACWYVDSRIPLRGASFPFSKPLHAPAYRHMFPGPLVFDAPTAQLRFDARYLSLPLCRDEQALHLMLQRALPLTVVPYRRDRLLVQQVRQALSVQTNVAHSATSLAQTLHMSTRTLHRQLQEEGASLQQLKDQVRSARACELLQRTRKPVKQVAQAVGFGNEKSFIRAFRGWTGRAPADYRRTAQANLPV